MKEKQIRVRLPLIVYVDWLIFYDAQNQLLSETIDGDTTSYTYDTAGNIRSVTGPGVTKTFTYDVTGLYKITYDAATKSLSATRVASYEYDAWGNVTYSTGEMADINPLRYRGDYQDWESGYYYLQSRYYDPAIGRFINADDEKTIFNALSDYESSDGLNGISYLDHNQFAYCLNNPVNMSDDEGDFAVAAGGTLYVAGAFGAANGWNPLGWVVLGTVAVLGIVALVGELSYQASKGGKQRILDTGLTGVSDDEITDRLKDPTVPKYEKQRLRKEQKARKLEM